MFGTQEPLSSAEEWLRRLQAGDRRVLAQLLSCAESTKADDERLLEGVLSTAVAQPRGVRLGVTGIPGAGKSTLIDVLGAHFVSQGKRVAVLAVDPSSPVSGGSILGDKLRMPRLSQTPAAFVRPLANRGITGGGMYALDDCVRLCELSGYDVVMVETVGVGQNETDVSLVCDATLLVVVPGTGDELQAFKRGVTEVVDVIAVNKDDLESGQGLERVEHSYREGLRYLRKEPLPVLSCSALLETGIEALAGELWTSATSKANEQARAIKRRRLLGRMIEHALTRQFWRRVGQMPEFEQLNRAVAEGDISLRAALQQALDLQQR